MTEHGIEINPLLQKLRDTPVAGNGETNYFTSFDGTEIFYRVWKPSKKVERIIVVAHGMGGHGEFFVLLADHLINHNIMVVAPDYRNHGNSEGKKGDLKKFKNILRDYNSFFNFMGEKYPNIPMYLLGESMGGAVSINFAGNFINTFSKLSGLILFAPAVKLNFSKLFWTGIGLVSPLIFLLRVIVPSKTLYPVKGDEDEGIKNPIHQQYDREDPLHLEKVSFRYLVQLFKYVRKTKKVASKITIPTLIFQGTDDALISPEGVRSFYNHIAAKDKKIVLVEEGFHSLLSDPRFQDKWNILVDWLKSH